jgi:alpha-amylase/alpha-mannosidase (GH57 family)
MYLRFCSHGMGHGQRDTPASSKMSVIRTVWTIWRGTQARSESPRTDTPHETRVSFSTAQLEATGIVYPNDAILVIYISTVYATHKIMCNMIRNNVQLCHMCHLLSAVNSVSASSLAVCRDKVD